MVLYCDVITASVELLCKKHIQSCYEIDNLQFVEPLGPCLLSLSSLALQLRARVSREKERDLKVWLHLLSLLLTIMLIMVNVRCWWRFVNCATKAREMEFIYDLIFSPENMIRQYKIPMANNNQHWWWCGLWLAIFQRGLASSYLGEDQENEWYAVTMILRKWETLIHITWSMFAEMKIWGGKSIVKLLIFLERITPHYSVA